jgi:hypothetical protein
MYELSATIPEINIYLKLKQKNGAFYVFCVVFLINCKIKNDAILFFVF